LRGGAPPTGTTIKIAVLANEFFDATLGRIGGFGWASSQVAHCLKDYAPRVEVVFLTGELQAAPGQTETTVHGTRLVLRRGSTLPDIRRTRAERPDLLLVIDYRPNYRLVCWALPKTPMIVWVRDPRPSEDVEKVDSLRIPGAEDTRPKGILQPDCSSLGTLARVGRWIGRPVLFASTASFLQDKLSRMIGMEVPDLSFLPNPIDLAPGVVRKSERPRVVSLARLDPYKRPWLCIELARRFPHVDFILAGHAHYEGQGAWNPNALPPNVQLVGHVDGPEKVRLLASAWVLVNTSIHEGLPVSMLEALACETPLLACVNPDGIVSRFGVYAGRFDETGLDAVPHLAAGLDRLLSDAALRERLGRDGRCWIEATHNRAAFLTSFHRLCARCGVHWNA